MTDSNKKNQVELQIGQIVYILSDKAEAIVPAIVVEELVHKKLDGNSVSWKVAVGPPEKKKIVSSDEISGEVYSSLEEIQVVMSKRLEKFVFDLLEKATKRTETWYGKQIVKNPNLSKGEPGKIDPSALLDIIDGREKGEQYKQFPGEEVNASKPAKSLRVRASVNNGPLKINNSSDPRSELRNKILEMAQVSEDPSYDDPSYDPSQEFLVTEDGRRIPVKYNVNE